MEKNALVAISALSLAGSILPPAIGTFSDLQKLRAWRNESLHDAGHDARCNWAWGTSYQGDII